MMTHAIREGRPLGWPAVGLSLGLMVFSWGPAGLFGSRESPASPPGARRGAEAARRAALTVVEYPLPRAGAFPHDPAVGPHRVVWYTAQANTYIPPLDPDRKT